MKIPFAWLNDLEQDEINPDLMRVCVGVRDTSNITFMEFKVSLSHMGITKDDEFELEFSKDLQRDLNIFYEKYQRIPTSMEYKVMTERHIYN